MITSKNEKLFNLSYFICLTLGCVPFITPAVITTTGPRFYRYYQFWLEHMLPYFSVFYMMFVHQKRPRLKNIYIPYLFLITLAVPAIYANTHIEGANFLYLATGTTGDSIANIMPQNLWLRLFIYLAIISLLFAIAYSPFFIKDYKARKLSKESTPSE